MAIRMCEDVVTRQDRRRQARVKEVDVRAKRDKARTKLVRNHHDALQDEEISKALADGVIIAKQEFTTKMVTGKAFIAALDWKHHKGSPSRADMGQAAVLQATTDRFICLARKIRNHLLMSRKGIIWGERLSDIYRELAEILNENTADIQTAVDFAESMKLLRRQEADGASATEWICIDSAA